MRLRIVLTLLLPLAAQPVRSNDELYRQATASLEGARYGEAEKGFMELRRLEPGRSRAPLGLAEVYARQDQLGDALVVINGEVKDHPDVPEYRTAFGILLSRTGQFDRAIAEYKVAVSLVSDPAAKADNFRRMGEAYHMKGQLDAALQQYERAGQAAAIQKLRLALRLDASGKKKEARRAYEEALALDPDNVVTLNNLAYRLAEDNVELEVALRHAERARKILPNDPNVGDTIGWIYLKQNRVNDAVAAFYALARNNPKNAAVRLHLATALQQSGDIGSARRELDIAETCRPTKVEARQIKELRKKLERSGSGG